MIIIDIVLCLLNLVLAFLNYEKKNYKAAMINCFLAGGVIVAVMFRITHL
jgi:uncharacterized membrane protein